MCILPRDRPRRQGWQLLNASLNLPPQKLHAARPASAGDARAAAAGARPRRVRYGSDYKAVLTALGVAAAPESEGGRYCYPLPAGKEAGAAARDHCQVRGVGLGWDRLVPVRSQLLVPAHALLPPQLTAKCGDFKPWAPAAETYAPGHFYIYKMQDVTPPLAYRGVVAAYNPQGARVFLVPDAYDAALGSSGGGGNGNGPAKAAAGSSGGDDDDDGDYLEGLLEEEEAAGDLGGSSAAEADGSGGGSAEAAGGGGGKGAGGGGGGADEMDGGGGKQAAEAPGGGLPEAAAEQQAAAASAVVDSKGGGAEAPAAAAAQQQAGDQIQDSAAQADQRQRQQ